ncbi:MAG: YIP1 family protein [Holophaga sp.]|nr:YIP1 family protein [Holophaga sp.]
MSEILSTPNPEPSLYGDEPKASLPPAKPQGVWDQLMGVFTEPSDVFRRLRVAPSWVGAFLLALGIGLFATIVWAAKVDQEAMTQRKFEVIERVFRTEIPAASVDQAMEKVATQGKPFISSSLGVVIGVPFVLVVMSGILFAFSRFGGEDEEVTFAHAWAAITVHGLTMVPITLLAGIMCLIRNVGGASSFASMAPTNLGFWIQPDNPWLSGVLGLFDPFYFFSFIALYLAARHTMRLKTWATALFLGIMGFFGFVFHFMGGIFR